MRSWLFVPGDSEHKISKALATNADVVILDLEDSVALQNKAKARAIVADVLINCRKTTSKVFVRVNALDSGFVHDDLKAIRASPPDGYMLPKSGSGEDVLNFSKLTASNLPIIAITTETAVSLFNLGTYGNTATPLSAMTWGAEDLSSGLGAIAAYDDEGHLTDPYRLARSLCLLGARAAGVEPIDSIHANFRDLADLQRQCHASVRDGFTGKMAIHPDQVPVINEAFTPSRKAVAKAKQIVAAFAAENDAGVISIDGRMFDRPHLERAQKLLHKAQRYPQAT